MGGNKNGNWGRADRSYEVSFSPLLLDYLHYKFMSGPASDKKSMLHLDKCLKSQGSSSIYRPRQSAMGDWFHTLENFHSFSFERF